MRISLEGKVALVTGASRGIGAAISRSLAGAGATVAVHYASKQEEAERIVAEVGNGSRAFRANLSDPDRCCDLFEAAVQAFGQVDVLVNNAGVAYSAPLEQPDAEWLEAWHRTQQVNLTAPAMLCRAAIQHFLQTGGGRIVNVSSRAAFRGDTPDYFAYAASKGGLVALTRSIARHFGKQNIVAFDVAPGFTRTDMAQDFITAYGEDYAMQGIALNRMTEPNDVANVVTFLASGLADHATGTTIDVNAGSYVH